MQQEQQQEVQPAETAPHQLVQMIKTKKNLNKNKKDPLFIEGLLLYNRAQGGVFYEIRWKRK